MYYLFAPLCYLKILSDGHQMFSCCFLYNGNFMKVDEWAMLCYVPPDNYATMSKPTNDIAFIIVHTT